MIGRSRPAVVPVLLLVFTLIGVACGSSAIGPVAAPGQRGGPDEQGAPDDRAESADTSAGPGKSESSDRTGSATSGGTDSRGELEQIALRRGRPSIRIVGPVDDATVEGTVELEVEAKNFELAPAGRTAEGEGHLHVLLDRGCLESGVKFPVDVGVVDLDDGRAVVELDLEPGSHELCVQVGDGFHVAVAIVDRVSFDVVAGAGGSSEPALD